MDRGGINGIRGIALPRTDLRQPRGARGGRDSLEITTPSRDDLSPSLSRALSRVPPTSLYASMHPFAARLRFAYYRNYRVQVYLFQIMFDDPIDSRPRTRNPGLEISK